MIARRGARRRLLAAVVALGVIHLVVVAPTPAAAAPTDEGRSGTTGHQPEYERKLLAKAAADECFAGVGLEYPPGPPCEAGQAKVNQGYLWGITRTGSSLWFGTGANVNCLTSGRNLDSTEPNLNDDWVCEYGQSQIVKRNPTLPANLGDHRPPRIYLYDLRASRLTEKTDLIKNASTDDANRLSSTAGIRAAGTHQGVVLLAGPALGESINLFAFDTSTGAYLGSTNLPQYGNIRHFVVADDALYAGVGVGANGGSRGNVLRWTGNRSNPFSFVEVADLPAQAADLTVHEGRIFVTTWLGSDEALAAPNTDEPSPGLASVWMSPKLSSGDRGLTPADAASWSRVWQVSAYEPDSFIARTYALGGLASYGGYLYWGTMHVPLKATYVHMTVYPPEDEEGLRSSVRGTQRAISIFRGKSFGSSSQRVDLLYGASELPAYTPAEDGGQGTWAGRSTNYTPLYGTMGIGNPWNNYTWKMVVAGGKLYVGTMDWSYISKDLDETTPESLGVTGLPADLGAVKLFTEEPPEEEPEPVFGGDLFVFDSPSKAAMVLDDSGLGNYLNYGIRNMVTDGSTLYLGMANPMNLRTDPGDDIPEGGWELIRLRERC